MTDATELDEAAIRARLEAATEGPWRVVVDHHRGHDVPDVSVWSDTAGVYVTEDVVFADSQFPVNAEFIAHARTDVGLLLPALDEARAQVERLHFDLDREARARQAAEQERDEARDQVEDCLRAGEEWRRDAEAAEGALAAVRDEAARTLVTARSAKNPAWEAATHRILRVLNDSPCPRAALATPTTTEED